MENLCVTQFSFPLFSLVLQGVPAHGRAASRLRKDLSRAMRKALPAGPIPGPCLPLFGATDPLCQTRGQERSRVGFFDVTPPPQKKKNQTKILQKPVNFPPSLALPSLEKSPSI